MGGEVMIYPQLTELMEAYSKEGFYGPRQRFRSCFSLHAIPVFV